MVQKIALIGIISSLFMLTACTYSITMIHTEGTATDVVDETQSTSAKVDPTINVPASVVPSI